MPITQSAKKALRQNTRRHAWNLARARAWKKAVKQAKKTPQNKEFLARAYQALDKAAKHGVIKKNTASRKKSRLVRSIGKEMQKSSSANPLSLSATQ